MALQQLPSSFNYRQLEFDKDVSMQAILTECVQSIGMVLG